MTTVWILSQGEMHEGGSVLGVYATKERAKGAFADAVRRLSFSVDDARQNPDGSIHLTAGCDWISLEPHKVEDQTQLPGGGGR